MIGFGTQESYRVGDPSDIAVVRRAGVALGKTQSFDEVRLGQLAIVITEAATNIIKHAGDGHILLRALYFESVTGVEIMSVDAGPGIADLELQMRDGNSTAGSYGVGLGAIERLSQEFDIYTNTGQGTVIRTVLWRDGERRSELPWLAGSVCLPMAGEEVCGDAFTVVANRDICTWILADGLGHGSLAAEASQKAIAVGDAGGEATPEELLQDIHCALRGSRGAAVAVGQINRELRVLRFSGIGNIAVSIFQRENRRHLLSHNGIVGSNMRKSQEFSESWAEGDMVVAHSDGINTRWDLEQYPGLAMCHPGIIAAILHRDYKRGNDDTSVLVLREQDHYS